MSFRPIYEGWDLKGRLMRGVRGTISNIGLNYNLRGAGTLADAIAQKLAMANLATDAGRYSFACAVVDDALGELGAGSAEDDLRDHLIELLIELIADNHWFAIPGLDAQAGIKRSELWEIEDQLKRVETIVDHIDDVRALAGQFIAVAIHPFLEQHPQLARGYTAEPGAISFETNLRDMLRDLPELIEHLSMLPFAPELDSPSLFPATRSRLEYNLNIASGGAPGDTDGVKNPKLPTRQPAMPPARLIEAYLAGTPLTRLFDYPLSISLPRATRFEHHHIVAGSGHGKTQTLQHLILHDLAAVAAREASIIVIDSQSDLINTIAGLEAFAPGNPLSERLVLIDPTDIEWPVALNLFDVGMDRLDQYSQLDRERLTNSILELYDFVLGSLLDAGMTQKQTVIFRYITRLLLHIPNATIHTLRELLEDGGHERYRRHIEKLQGSARAFFEQEFNGREFVATKRQVLRRLYGILENQTFERMFSHPKSKLDLFAEMNAGKVILINTAKDLLKENGTEILGRFFIAMIAQAAQERAVLRPGDRLPTFVYVDEANDYFDRNIGVILSQARKYNVGMVLAHQYLGQLDPKLHEAIAANTAIKFAGGVSARDARALASDLRTDAGFIERQPRLSFAAFIKGETETAVSLGIEPGRMEALDRMDEDDREAVRQRMRRQYAVHYSELNVGNENEPEPDADDADTGSDDPPHGSGRDGRGPDDGEPQAW